MVLIPSQGCAERTGQTLHALSRGGCGDLSVFVALPQGSPLPAVPEGLGALRTLSREPGLDPLPILDLRPGEPLFLVEDGSLPPPGWCGLLEAHLDRERRASAPTLVCGCTNQASGPERVDGPLHREPQNWAAELEVWWREQRECLSRWGRVHEHVERADSPVFLIDDALSRRAQLHEWWRERLLRPLAAPPEAQLLLARDLVVYRSGPCAARLGVELVDPALPTPQERLGLTDVLEHRSLLQAALADAPRPALHLYLAELMGRTAHTTQARSHAKAGLEHWPNHVEGSLCLAEAEAQGGSDLCARARLDSLLQWGPLDGRRRARLLAILGETWRSAGDASQAEQCFDSALDLDPAQPLALTGRGRLFLETGEFDAALADLAAATRHDTLRATAWFHLARALAMIGESARARETLAKTLLLNRRHRPARTLLERLRGAAGPPATLTA